MPSPSESKPSASTDRKNSRRRLIKDRPKGAERFNGINESRKIDGLDHVGVDAQLVLVAAACGGGGSDGTVESASDAQKVTFIKGAV